MIVKNYDIGWGTNWPMKQLEQEILEHTLSKFRVDASRTVVINSVWYTGDYHQQVMQELRELCPTHIIVVAMLDPPVVKLEWFEELDCEVIGVGYYPNSDVDYFAKFMDRFYQMPNCDLLDESMIDTAYMCLNRKPHLHRLRLYQGLENAGILNSGFVSMGGIPPMRLLDNDVEGQNFAPNGGIEQYGIGNDIASLGNIDYWRRHFVNIVTETSWNIEPSGFLSEKTFKPIFGCRPFLIYAEHGGLECLKKRGIEPYVSDFSDITDLDLTQPWALSEFLKILCNQDATYWQMKFNQLLPKILHNQSLYSKK